MTNFLVVSFQQDVVAFYPNTVPFQAKEPRKLLGGDGGGGRSGSCCVILVLCNVIGLINFFIQ